MTEIKLPTKLPIKGNIKCFHRAYGLAFMKQRKLLKAVKTSRHSICMGQI